MKNICGINIGKRQMKKPGLLLPDFDLSHDNIVHIAMTVIFTNAILRHF